jgi:hypothetical protein
MPEKDVLMNMNGSRHDVEECVIGDGRMVYNDARMVPENNVLI